MKEKAIPQKIFPSLRSITSSTSIGGVGDRFYTQGKFKMKIYYTPPAKTTGKNF